MTPDSRAERPSWTSLTSHSTDVKSLHLRELFSVDADRGEKFHLETEGFYFDFAKQLVTEETLGLLLQLARESDVAERRDAMFAGEHINVSENRAVLHVALRMPRDETLVVDGVEVVAEVHRVLDQMSRFAEAVRSG